MGRADHVQKPSETHLAMRILHWVSHSKLDIRPVLDRQCAPDVGKNLNLCMAAGICSLDKPSFLAFLKKNCGECLLRAEYS